jgi:hypothetical protein
VAARFIEHRRLRVDADHFVEQRGQLHRQEPRAATHVDQRAIPVEAELGPHHLR